MGSFVRTISKSWSYQSDHFWSVYCFIAPAIKKVAKNCWVSYFFTVFQFNAEKNVAHIIFVWIICVHWEVYIFHLQNSIWKWCERVFVEKSENLLIMSRQNSALNCGIAWKMKYVTCSSVLDYSEIMIEGSIAWGSNHVKVINFDRKLHHKDVHHSSHRTKAINISFFREYRKTRRERAKSWLGRLAYVEARENDIQTWHWIEAMKN